jgi:hypothetical protein
MVSCRHHSCGFDGSRCETPGYDPASKLLFKADGLFPPIPQQPSREEALNALALLNIMQMLPRADADA